MVRQKAQVRSPGRVGERREEEEDRPAPGLRGALPRRHPRLPGAEPHPSNPEAQAGRPEAVQHRSAPFIQFEQKRPSGKQTLTIEELDQALRPGDEVVRAASRRW